MKSSKHCYKVLKKFNITENDAIVQSFGNSGFFIIYVDTNNNLKKERINCLGLSYINEVDFEEAIQKLDIRNKKTMDIPNISWGPNR
jgi:hypothetical protein